MKINVKSDKSHIYTHGDAIAKHITPTQQLRRSVMSCMLWEDTFYEEGISIAERIAQLVQEVDIKVVSDIAIEAREKMKLRHIPLLLVREMARHKDSNKSIVSKTLERIIQRPDELNEFLAIYWKDKKQPLSNQVKKGLAAAFTKFDEYQLAKYNRDKDITLRDVLFLCHGKPKDKDQEELWKRLVNNELKIPDTWEVSLSSGKDKKETFTRLLTENKLGGLALLRNLRNMIDSGVDHQLIKDRILTMRSDRILPFRFVEASNYSPRFESELETAMIALLKNKEKLKGKTILIVDTSGSMWCSNLSRKSELSRIKAAASLAILVKEISESPVIYATAGDDGTRIHATKELPSRSGFALKDRICDESLFNEIGRGGIFLTQCMDYVKDIEKSCDRIIVITDEQDCDNKQSPLLANPFGAHNYLINLSSNKNGIGYGKKWIHLDGFSESVIDFIQEYEKSLELNKID